MLKKLRLDKTKVKFRLNYITPPPHPKMMSLKVLLFHFPLPNFPPPIVPPALSLFPYPPTLFIK